MGRPEEEVTAVGRAEILDTAKQYVTKDRQSTHGKPEDSFGRISEYWSAHLKREVTRQDVAVMMTLLKVARFDANPDNPDNWIDACGYLACGGEMATSPDAVEETEAAEWRTFRTFNNNFKD